MPTQSLPRPRPPASEPDARRPARRGRSARTLPSNALVTIGVAPDGNGVRAPRDAPRSALALSDQGRSSPPVYPEIRFGEEDLFVALPCPARILRKGAHAAASKAAGFRRAKRERRGGTSPICRSFFLSAPRRSEWPAMFPWPPLHWGLPVVDHTSASWLHCQMNFFLHGDYAGFILSYSANSRRCRSPVLKKCRPRVMTVKISSPARVCRWLP